MNRLYLVFSLFFLYSLLFFTSCSPALPANISYAWEYQHLRLLDPVDSSSPESDINALYLRRRGDNWQLRLDLLDVTDPAGFDLWLAIDSSPGGAATFPTQLPFSGFVRPPFNWDRLLRFPANGRFQAYRPDGSPASSLALRLERDPILDTYTVIFSDTALPGRPHNINLWVWTTQPSSMVVSDSSTNISSTGAPPPRQKILFAVWNTMPASTPAQALRRWDGAHTGPFGTRHGLRHLLSATRRTQTPLFLLDLKTPEALSALDYLDVLNSVTSGVYAKFFILPDVILPPMLGIPDPANISRMAQDSRFSASNFLLPASSFLYSPQLDQIQNIDLIYRTVFTHTLRSASDSEFVPIVDFFRLADTTYLLLPAPDPNQATSTGPHFELRRTLADLAVTSPNLVILLGGSLPFSSWGDPELAHFTLNYLNHRPWLQFLYPADLISPANFNYVNPPPEPGPTASPLPQITSSLAWEVYRSLSQPEPFFPSEATALRRSSFSLVHMYDYVARWLIDPQPISSCQLDIDSDSSPECVLSSSVIFAVYQPGEVGLKLLFYRSPDKFNNDYAQIVAPSSTLALGLSDPSSWNLTAGPLADPSVIPGGFALPATVPPSLDSNSITIPGDPALTISLAPDGIRFYLDFHSAGPRTLELPLAIQPARRFTPDWRSDVFLSETASGYIVGWKSGLRLRLDASFPLTLDSFITSPAPFTIPENPDYEYPSGHFLPFPLSIARLTCPDDCWLDLAVLPPP